MPDIKNISVALTGEQLTALRAAVETGDYATTSEIVGEAVRDWQFKRTSPRGRQTSPATLASGQG